MVYQKISKSASSDSTSPEKSTSIAPQSVPSSPTSIAHFYNFTQIPAYSPVIQAKLTIGAPNDRYEQEADRIAAQVVQQLHHPASIQRQGKLDKTIQAKSMLQRPDAIVTSEADPEVATAIDRQRGSGQPLDRTLQRQMESAFGSDFSGVRVHTDTNAHSLNESLSARAFTTRQDIFFRQGEYNPGSSGGKELVAHELTHVVQQSGAIQAKLTIGQPNDRYEQEADRFAGQVIRMTTPLIQCQPAPATQQPSTVSTTTPSLPSADELTTRIARCIGIWETNRGKDTPDPKESSLDTVAGVHASMATIEQATMPYAINALKQHKSLRDKAIPPLKIAELNSAEKICTAVETLLKSITQASKQGEIPDDFINTKANLITATGLSNDDIKIMFSAVELRTILDTALTDANAASKAAKEEAQKAKKTPKQQADAGKAAKQYAVQNSIDAIPSTERLGLGKGSLRAYINKPQNWGENRAGWQRKAVSLMADNIGSRIESIALSDGGTALVIPIVGGRVNAELAKTPVPSLEDIVKTVAQKNNPNETKYGKHVWETYNRLYP